MQKNFLGHPVKVDAFNNHATITGHLHLSDDQGLILLVQGAYPNTYLQANISFPSVSGSPPNPPTRTSYLQPFEDPSKSLLVNVEDPGNQVTDEGICHCSVLYSVNPNLLISHVDSNDEEGVHWHADN